MNIQFLDAVVLIVIAAYAIYLYFFDCRQVADERRELIRLKSLRISQKVMSILLIILTIGHLMNFKMEAQYIVALMVFATCLSEVLSKIYFESRY